jgi:hypothetical protein
VSGEAWRKEAEGKTYLAISDILDSSTHRLARLWKRGVISTLSDAAVDKARSNDPRCTSRPTTSSGVVLDPTHQLSLSLHISEEGTRTYHVGGNHHPDQPISVETEQGRIPPAYLPM